MKRQLQALVVLATVLAVTMLAAQLNFVSSYASPPMANATPTATPRRNRPAAVPMTIYMPFIIVPPRPNFLPFIAGPLPPTPTPTTIPGNPVWNGGFELADYQGNPRPWYATLQYPDGHVEGIPYKSSQSTLATVGVSPHAGAYASWLGNYLDIAINLQQEVTIPASASTLTYWAWIQSDENVCDIGNVDGAWIFFITTQQNQLDAYALCKANATTGWVRRDLNITGYRGQTVWLTYTVRNYGANSNLFIDDVSVD